MVQSLPMAQAFNGPATLVISSATALRRRHAGSVSLSGLQQRERDGRNALVNSTSHAVDADLTVNASYSWQARAEYQGSVGPWSTKHIHRAGERIPRYETFADPLTNGKTVGQQRGNTFILVRDGRRSLRLMASTTIFRTIAMTCYAGVRRHELRWTEVSRS